MAISLVDRCLEHGVVEGRAGKEPRLDLAVGQLEMVLRFHGIGSLIEVSVQNPNAILRAWRLIRRVWLPADDKALTMLNNITITSLIEYQSPILVVQEHLKAIDFLRHVLLTLLELILGKLKVEKTWHVLDSTMRTLTSSKKQARTTQNIKAGPI